MTREFRISESLMTKILNYIGNSGSWAQANPLMTEIQEEVNPQLIEETNAKAETEA